MVAYNLADDIGEEHDMSQKHPDKAESLLKDWEDWNKQMLPPAWTVGFRGGKRKQPKTP